MKRRTALVVDRDETRGRRLGERLQRRGMRVVFVDDATGWPDVRADLVFLAGEADSEAPSSVWLDRCCQGIESADHDRLPGLSRAAVRLHQQIRLHGASREPLFLVGAAGSGKAHAARRIHAARGGAPAELFEVDGRHSGSVNGLAAALRGVAAPGRSLLVRHAVHLPRASQRLLAGSFDRFARGLFVTGSEEPCSLRRRGRLQADLARRFESVLAVPGLHDRAEDIPALVRGFLDEIAALNRLAHLSIDATALDRMQAYAWPENVRELRQVIERAALLAEEGVIREAQLPEGVRLSETTAPRALPIRADRQFKETKREVVEAFERAYLLDLLQRHRGNVTAAAESAGMLRSALQRLLRKHGIVSASYRPGPGSDLSAP